MKTSKVAFFSYIPLKEVIAERIWPVFSPVLIEKYRDGIETLLEEGYAAGFDTNSPSLPIIIGPILKKEGIKKAVVTVPTDMREILSAVEIIENMDFFLFKYSENLEGEISVFLKWLGSGNEKNLPGKWNEFLDQYSGMCEDSKFIPHKFLPAFYDFFSAGSVRVLAEIFKMENSSLPLVGLLGEFPPSSHLFVILLRYFRIGFLEAPCLLVQPEILTDQEFLSSPLNRVAFFNSVASRKKLLGFIFFYYTLSSWQNYEIIYREKLNVPVIGIELKDFFAFGEREKLRLETFSNQLKNGGI